ncbi:MAG TPA: mercuric reductase [Candidatus Binataceae bacterium]|nr:mercuric reductase [Candidatus Binataceae bacterium]
MLTRTLSARHRYGLMPILIPADSHDHRLISLVHPLDWRNPHGDGRYNLVVIGAGTAGLVCAAGAAGLGAKVALIERELMGGDCLNFGCVPSKALLRSARAYADVSRAAEYGIVVPAEIKADFSAVMTRMRRLRAELADKDSAPRFCALGVDVFIGEARFSAPDTVDVNGQRLRFSRAVIATGSRANSLPVQGLAEAGFLTNETIFSLTALPARLAIIGGGPLGCELAQAFARFGARVTVFEAEASILPKEDPDAAVLVKNALKRGGIEIIEDCRIQNVQKDGNNKAVNVECGGAQRELAFDEMLLATGRVPTVNNLGLEAAGVDYDHRTGIKVNDQLRTSNRRIFAAGDVCSPYKFTHAADAMARIVIRNALFYGRERVSDLTIPWCTYTDPEVAHVGLSGNEARRLGIRFRTLVQPLHDVDRALLDGEGEGFLKIHVRQGSDRIIGATMVAKHAGETISELTLAISAKVGLTGIGRVIHPYPTQAEAVRKIADAYNRTRLTPRLHWLFRRWLAWMRR